MSHGTTTSYPLRRVINSTIVFGVDHADPTSWERTPQMRTDGLECGHVIGPAMMAPAKRRRCTRCPSNDRRGPVPRMEHP